MKIQPFFDRVVILPVASKDNSSTLFLPESSKEKQQIGQIVAVGDGESTDYNKREMKVKVGDKVLYNMYAGAEFRENDTTYIIMRQIDLIGVIDD